MNVIWLEPEYALIQDFIIDREAREIIRLVASIRLSVRPSVCQFVCRYMGSACRVLRKITMTHGIPSKISVCLSVIRKHSRSRAARSGQGLLIGWCDWFLFKIHSECLKVINPRILENWFESRANQVTINIHLTRCQPHTQNKKLVKVSQKVGRNWSPCLRRQYWS